jgi:hypothetical protein
MFRYTGGIEKLKAAINIVSIPLIKKLSGKGDLPLMKMHAKMLCIFGFLKILKIFMTWHFQESWKPGQNCLCPMGHQKAGRKVCCFLSGFP